jgi:dolichol kinase
MLNERAERVRKSIHLAVGVLPLAAWWLIGVRPMLTRDGLVFVAFLAMALDRARNYNAGWKGWIEARVGSLLRPGERGGILGPTWMAVSMAILFLFLPRTLALAGMLFLIVGDALAAIIGRRVGRIRLTPWATLEGSAAGLVATLALVPLLRLLDPDVRPLVLIGGALAASLAEAVVPGRLDNLVVPVISGVVMQLLASNG